MMKTSNLSIIEEQLEIALTEIDSFGENEAWVNEDLVKDMAKACEAVYDTATKTETFLLNQKLHQKI